MALKYSPSARRRPRQIFVSYSREGDEDKAVEGGKEIKIEVKTKRIDIMKVLAKPLFMIFWPKWYII